MNRKVLIVEDDKKLAELVRLYLERDGYRVVVTHDGRAGLDAARHGHPDLIILDLMLPGVNGLDLCRTVRAECDIPIIMLTAKSTEDDKLAGLDLGADDYITKPFSPREVVARVRAVLRRSPDGKESEPSRITVGDVEIDLGAHTVRLRDQIVSLTPKEFKMITVMAKQPGRAFTRLELLEDVFGPDYEGLERTVDVHVMNLRKKIETDPARPTYVQTVYGVGYRFGGETNHVE